MKQLFIVFIGMFLFVTSINAQTKKNGTPDMRYNSNKQSSGTSYGGSRPVYPGETHTTSHGGNYNGEQNTQSHKGGTYVNPSSNNQYGIHKKK